MPNEAPNDSVDEAVTDAAGDAPRDPADESERMRRRAVVRPGHGVASGRSGDPRFPGGTIKMQLPHFAERGVDLSRFHPATMNLDLSPCRVSVPSPRVTLRDVKWHPSEPAEDFSFADARIEWNGTWHDAQVYWPHPETKPEHEQAPGILEVLAPRLEGVEYGDTLTVEVDPRQVRLDDC